MWYLDLDGKDLPVEWISSGDGEGDLQVGDRRARISFARLPGSPLVVIRMEGRNYVLTRGEDQEVEMLAPHRRWMVPVPLHTLPAELRASLKATVPSTVTLTAPMAGKVVELLVQPGDTVEADAPLVVMEAMKMRNEMRAPMRAVVERVEVTPGAPVDRGQTLVVLRRAEDTAS